MKFINALAVVALAAGAVQALPAADANDIVAREAKKGGKGKTALPTIATPTLAVPTSTPTSGSSSGSVSSELTNLAGLLTSVQSSVQSAVDGGVSDLTSVVGLIGTALNTVTGLI